MPAMKTVFVDVDTQLDFVYPAGALYVPGAEKLMPVWIKLGSYAGARGIPLISTLDSHVENDPEFRTWPHHCVEGTLGHRKPQDLLFGEKQSFVKKQVLDPFATDDLKQEVTRTGAGRCVVYGVVTEICVRLAALGLAKMGLRVDLVTDAIKELSETKRKETCDELTARGVNLISAAEVLQL